jgi:hypothetical protein
LKPPASGVSQLKKSSEPVFAGVPASKLLVALVAVVIAGASLFYWPAAATAPQGAAGELNVSLSVNSGDEFTSTKAVTLSLAAEGAEKCRYSNDNSLWTDYEAPVETRSWTLSSEDERKTVFVQCKAGQKVSRAQAIIILDSSPPEISVGSPSPRTESPFTFSFAVEDEWSQDVECTALFDGATVPLKHADSLFYADLAASPGAYLLEAKCVDEAGNQASAEKDVLVTEAILRPTPSPEAERPIAPYGLEISINNGDYSTGSKSVVLYLKAKEAATCSYSNDGSSFSAWEPYSEVKQWTLVGEPGTKQVYYRCRNKYGDSETVSDYIELLSAGQVQEGPSQLSISINSGDKYANDTEVELSLSAQNALDCRYSNDGAAYSYWSAYVTKKAWELEEGDGEKTVYYQCRNGYSTSQPASDSIVLDTEPPTGVFDLKGDLFLGAAPDTGFVVLEWSDSEDETSGLKEYFVYRQDGNQPEEPPEIVGTPTESYFQDELEGEEVENFWQYYVVPYDKAGNKGSASNLAEINAEV